MIFKLYQEQVGTTGTTTAGAPWFFSLGTQQKELMHHYHVARRDSPLQLALWDAAIAKVAVLLPFLCPGRSGIMRSVVCCAMLLFL